MKKFKNYNEYTGAFRELYEKAEYQAAYDVVTAWMDDFPEQIWRIYNWRVCLTAKMGNHEHALDFLDEALDKGIWYSEKILSMDEDLAGLSGLPRFDDYIEKSGQEEAEAKGHAQQVIKIFDAEFTGEQKLSSGIMIYHGNASSVEHQSSFWQPLAEYGFFVALPESSQMVGSNAFVWDDWDTAKNETTEHLSWLRNIEDWENLDLYFGGFSMGGGVAMWLSMIDEFSLIKGFIVLAPFIPDINRFKPLLHDARERGIRG